MSILFRIIIFITLTALVVYVSRGYFKSDHRYGFYRFFAFECVIFLFIANIPYWFRNPFSLPQILAWLSLTISLVLVLMGVLLLRRIGKPTDQLEATTRLVTSGIYARIRHPLYSSLLWLGAGIFLKNITLFTAACLLALLAFLISTARLEEVENLKKFGVTYREYMQRTKMFIPYIL